MKRVTGIGGIFFKAKDAAALQAWYKRHLGIDVQAWGGTAFNWADCDGKPTTGSTVWSIGAAEGDQFAPSTATFMVNYRVADLYALVNPEFPLATPRIRLHCANILIVNDNQRDSAFALAHLF